MAEISDIADVKKVPPEQRSENLRVAKIDAEPDEPLLAITDNLRRDAIVGQAELDAIERYMSDILDQVLGVPMSTDTDCRSTANARKRSGRPVGLL